LFAVAGERKQNFAGATIGRSKAELSCKEVQTRKGKE